MPHQKGDGDEQIPRHLMSDQQRKSQKTPTYDLGRYEPHHTEKCKPGKGQPRDPKEFFRTFKVHIVDLSLLTDVLFVQDFSDLFQCLNGF